MSTTKSLIQGASLEGHKNLEERVQKVKGAKDQKFAKTFRKMYNTCTHKKPGISLKGKAINKPNNKPAMKEQD